jgi:DNA-binding beta-propeller fold protein YncE
VIRVDPRRAKVTQTRRLSPRARPKDVRLSPDGTLYISDPARGGVWTVDAHHLRPTAFIPTGAGAHGLIPAQGVLYVTNRAEGTISVIDLTTHRVIRRWSLPGDSAPRLGSVSADGRVLWLSDRRHDQVYAVSTATGRLIHTIHVGRAPHGIRVFPHPGRHSLGHTYR